MNFIELFSLGLLSTFHAMGSAGINPSQDCHLIFSKTFTATTCQLVIAMGFANQGLTLWKAFFFAKHIWEKETSSVYIFLLVCDIIIPRVNSLPFLFLFFFFLISCMHGIIIGFYEMISVAYLEKVKKY